MATASSAYLDIGDYLRAATNQETASLLGLNTTLAAGVAAGALTLPVASSSGWATGPIWLLDGPWAERAQLTGAPDGATLTLAAPGVTLAHGAGVSVSQAGPSGALAEVILRASGWICTDDRVVVLNTGAGLKYPETVDVGELPLVR